MQEAAHHYYGQGCCQHGAEQGAQQILGGHGRLLEGEAGGDDGAEEVEAGALYREQAGTEGPKRRVWMKEAMPDMTSDMETI